ncbi:MAG TPA: PIN domain-containing protein [Waddliaceae bacterium]
METQFTVLLDACVLYPAPLRDLLIELATRGMFRGRWTNQIHEEWIRNLLKNRPDLKKDQLERTRKLMNERVLDCLVHDYEDLMEGINLPDHKDVHVVAAAIKAHAQTIVTYNTKDFPAEILNKYEIEAQHPDTFLRHQLDLKLSVFLSAVKNIRQRLKKPPASASQYLAILFPHLPQTVSILKQYENLI